MHNDIEYFSIIHHSPSSSLSTEGELRFNAQGKVAGDGLPKGWGDSRLDTLERERRLRGVFVSWLE